MSLPKLRNTLDQPPQGLEEGEWKWIKRGLGATAVAAAMAVPVLVHERMARDDFIEINATQSEELSAINHQLLTKFSTLPFDASGHIERAVPVEGKPDYKNRLEVQLTVEGDTFVIDGEAHHTGLTQQTNTPYDDPASFQLSYRLDQTTTHTVPGELLKEVMESGRMPSELHYAITEDRPSYGRYNSEDGLDDKGTQANDVVLRVNSEGELTAIQVGKVRSTDSQDLTDQVEEVYSEIIDELERVGA